MPRPDWSNRLEKPENEGMPRLQRQKYNLIVLKRKVRRALTAKAMTYLDETYAACGRGFMCRFL